MDKNYLNKILLRAQELNASDIHLSTSLKPYLRNNGDIDYIDDFQELTANDILNIFLSISEENIQKNFLQFYQADFAYFNSLNKTRYRVNIYKTNKGISIAFRQLNTNIPVLEENYPEILQKISNLEKGIILVCGQTGSGKSTTMASILDSINRNKKKHIITLEDPIEYIFNTKKSLIDQREVGKHINSFSDGLKGALREDPDVIMIGEMRDKETIKMALTAAETGHLVISTLHTMSASKTIDRIIDSCDLSEKEVIRSMLSTSLQAIILQTLLKKKDSSGRIPAYEILIGTSGIRNLIRENKVYQIDSLIQTNSKYGMITMKDYVNHLYEEGKVSKEEVESKIFQIDKVENN